MDKKYLSDYITNEDIKKWNCKFGRKKEIIIQAPTGIGKSYFIKNNLYDMAYTNNEQILMLVNRADLKEEFQLELEKEHKTDHITVMTYQSLEAYKENTHGDLMELSDYDYIICDESHYFFQDSLFNQHTQESFNTIKNTNSVKMFMSATNDLFIRYLDYYNYEYELINIENNYDYIENIAFFNNNNCIYEMLSECKEKNQKCIVFIQDIEEALDLYEAFKEDSLFLCSKSNKPYYRYVDKEAKKEMLKNHKFDCLFLITTNVFENGNNILDPDLHHIIISLNDITSIQQAIGRKRLTSDKDYLCLAIGNLDNRKLRGLIANNEKYIERADILINEGEEVYVTSFGKNYNPIVYTTWNKEKDCVELAINYFMYFKAKENLLLYSSWYNDEYHVGFKKAILKMLKKDWNDTYKLDLDYTYERDRITNILKEYEGILLPNTLQSDLINKLNIKNDKYRIIKNLNKINERLEVYKICYKINKDRKYINRKKQTIWIVQRK